MNGKMLALWAGMGAGAFAAVITDKTGYVTFTATDAGGTSSLVAGGVKHWSDGLDPHAGADYLVQGNGNANWFSASTFLVRTADNGADATFAGDSLTRADGCLNLKHKASGTFTANWVLYGCRIAAGNVTAGKPATEYNLRLDGPMLVKGTSANPSCFTGSANQGVRAMTVASALTGDADAVVKVCKTPTDGGDSTAYNFRCCFRGANDAYQGRWRLVGGGSCRYYLDFIGTAAMGTHDGADGQPLIEVSNNGWLRCQAVAFTNANHVAATGNLNVIAVVAGALSERRGSEGAYFAKGFALKGDGTGSLNLYASGATVALDDQRPAPGRQRDSHRAP